MQNKKKTNLQNHQYGIETQPMKSAHVVHSVPFQEILARRFY